MFVCRRLSDPSTSTCHRCPDRVESELGCDYDCIAEGRECFTDNVFIDEGTVDFRWVKESYTALDSGADELDRLALLRSGAEAQTHTSEAEC